MDSKYEIFECLPDGSFHWHDSARGLIHCRHTLRELVGHCDREYFGIGLTTKELIFPVLGPALNRRVFQIAYTEKLGRQRADVLRKCGYGVLSVVGNDAAKALLGMMQSQSVDIDFFMIGHAAPLCTRKEMVDWLRSRYARSKILVLNPPNQNTAGADFNVWLQNGPESWLPIITAQTGATGA